MKKREKSVIPPEKMARIAERGLSAVRLSKREKEYLLSEGMDELYAVQALEKQRIPQIDENIVKTIMNRFFSQPEIIKNQSEPAIWLNLKNNALETIQTLAGWRTPSPAFVYRASESPGISYHKDAGRFSVHMEIVRKDKRRVDMHIRLTDETKRECSSFEVELLKDERCIESMSVSETNTAVLSSIEIGDYTLRVADAKGEITSVSIRMDH